MVLSIRSLIQGFERDEICYSGISPNEYRHFVLDQCHSVSYPRSIRSDLPLAKGKGSQYPLDGRLRSARSIIVG